MKAFLIALALASLVPSPLDPPANVGSSRQAAPAAQREASSSEPPAWLLALTGLAAIALMRRPRR